MTNSKIKDKTNFREMEEKQIIIDGFVDVIITITLDRRTHNKSKRSVLLVSHTIFRPTSEEEPITRHDVLSCLRKMLL